MVILLSFSIIVGANDSGVVSISTKLIQWFEIPEQVSLPFPVDAGSVSKLDSCVFNRKGSSKHGHVEVLKELDFLMSKVSRGSSSECQGICKFHQIF